MLQVALSSLFLTEQGLLDLSLTWRSLEEA